MATGQSGLGEHLDLIEVTAEDAGVWNVPMMQWGGGSTIVKQGKKKNTLVSPLEAECGERTMTLDLWLSPEQLSTLAACSSSKAGLTGTLTADLWTEQTPPVNTTQWRNWLHIMTRPSPRCRTSRTSVWGHRRRPHSRCRSPCSRCRAHRGRSAGRLRWGGSGTARCCGHSDSPRKTDTWRSRCPAGYRHILWRIVGIYSVKIREPLEV